MAYEPSTTSVSAAAPRRRLFTVESASAALVLVAKVVGEVVQRYAELMDLRTRRQELALRRGSRRQAEELGARAAAAVETLERLNRELRQVGCELKDWAAGCVDFPAVHRGRAVRLCWQLGEPRVAFWHEAGAGLAARRPAGPDFGR